MTRESAKKRGRTDIDATYPYFVQHRNYAISMTFFGNGRCDCALVRSQTFARHRPTNGATTIEPNATASAACILVTSMPVGFATSRALWLRSRGSLRWILVWHFLTIGGGTRSMNPTKPHCSAT